MESHMATTRSSHRYRRISNFNKCYALLSEDDSTDTAVVFIHGFGGDPVTTWLNFQGLVDTTTISPGFWKTADLFFYRYKSVQDHLHVNGEAILEFINHVFPSPSPEILSFFDVDAVVDGVEVRPRDLQLDPTNRYRNLIIVGHSEGGLLIRRSLLDTVKGMEDEQLAEISDSLEPSVLKARVRLFAPALMGVTFSGLIGVIAHSSFLGNLGSWALLGSRAAADMSNETNIQTIQNGTEHEARKWKKLIGLRAKVLWGGKDSIVTPNEYAVDTKKTELDKNHTSVCKPTSDYSAPLELVSGP
jgi:hypothetical protein